MNKFKKYLKLFIFTICIGFLSYKFSESYSNIVSEVQLSIFEIFFLLFCSVIYLNITSFRAFLLIKSSVGYVYSYNDWSKLYFESLIISSVNNFAGIAYKGFQLKKRNVNYTKFIAISYLLFGSYLSISLIFISLELFFFKKVIHEVYIILATILVFIFFFAPTIAENLIEFFFKFKILGRYLKSVLKLFEILKKTFYKKKTITILYLNTIIVHIFEIGIFYLLFTIFLDNANVEIIIILFAANFIVDRIPFFSEIPGISEIVLGMIAVPLGIGFAEGAIIKLSSRFLALFSILLNSGVYFVISYFDKNKFVRV